MRRVTVALALLALVGLGVLAWLFVRSRAGADFDATTKSRTERTDAPQPAAAAATREEERSKEPAPSDSALEAAPPAAPPPNAAAARATRPFFVRVVDEEDGHAIAGATVVDSGTGGESVDEAARRLRPTSVGAGLLEIELLDRRGLQVERLMADGYAPAWFVAVAGEHDAAVDALEVELSRAATLVGRLLDADGRPAAGRRLFAANSSHAAMERRVAFQVPVEYVDEPEATSDELGRFELGPLLPDVDLPVFVLSRSEEEFADVRSVVLEPGERRSVEWRLSGPCSIRGRVVDSRGAAIADAQVSLSWSGPTTSTIGRNGGATTRTDSAGRFEFTAAPSGRCTLNAASRDGALRGLRRDLPASSSRDDEVVLVLEGTAPLRVHLVDGSGSPVRGFTVFVERDERWLPVGSATSDRAGVATIAAVPLGHVKVRSFLVSRAFADVSVPFDHDGEHDCSITLPAAATIHGRAVDLARGARAVLAPNVWVIDRATGAEWMQRTVRDQPEFTTSSLPPGTFDVLVAVEDGRVGVLEDVALRAGESKEVEVKVSSGAWLRVRPRASLVPADADGGRVIVRRGERVVGVEPWFGSPPYELGLLVWPGHLTVELRALGRTLATREVDAVAERRARVDF